MVYSVLAYKSPPVTLFVDMKNESNMVYNSIIDIAEPEQEIISTKAIIISHVN